MTYAELPENIKCLMDCEAADILQGVQEQMVMLSRDPTIKIPVWGHWAPFLLKRMHGLFMVYGWRSVWVIWISSFSVVDHLTRACSMPKVIASTQILSLLDAFLSILNLSGCCVFIHLCAYLFLGLFAWINGITALLYITVLYLSPLCSSAFFSWLIY